MKLNGQDIPVLAYLSDEHFLSEKQLIRESGISRVAIWKQIQKLKILGYNITTDAKKGYRMISRPDILFPSEIHRSLHTKYIGRQIFYYKQVVSTNSLVKKYIKDKNVYFLDGAVVIADIQTAGRGRFGRTWYSPYGGIWLTIILFPNLELIYLTKITLMAAVALVQSIKNYHPISPKIKWPNDLVAGSRKLCGILTEMAAESDRINYVLVGIGINANIKSQDFPEDIRSHSTSLQEMLGESVSRIKLVQVLLENFEKYYNILQNKQFVSILEEWKENTDTLGKNITISSAGQTISGEAVDLTSEGALVIKQKDGKLINIISGTLQQEITKKS